MRFGKEYDISRAIESSTEKTILEQSCDPLNTWPRVYRLVESVEWHINRQGMKQTYIEELQQAKETHGSVVVLDVMGFGAFFKDLQENYGVCDLGVGICLGDNRSQQQREADAVLGRYRVPRNILTHEAWKDVGALFSLYNVAAANSILFFPGAGGYSSYITSRVDVFEERILRPMWEHLHPDGGVLHMELPDHIVWHNSKRFSEWFSAVQSILPEAEFYKSKSSWRMLRLVKSPEISSLPDMREYLR